MYIVISDYIVLLNVKPLYAMSMIMYCTCLSISGTMAALLQEIVAIYPAVNPSTLTVSIIAL